MFNFIVDVFIYTFAVYGIIAFISQIIENINNYKNNNKIILIFEKNDDNIEGMMREVLKVVKKSGIAKKVYVFSENKNGINSKIAEKFANDNDIFVTNGSKKLMNFIKE